jgi:methyl-accepting chemotaxis protein
MNEQRQAVSLLDHPCSDAYDHEMNIMPVSTTPLLQVTALPDTVLTKIVQDPSVFDYASGTLEILVLLVGAIALSTLVWSLIVFTRTIRRLEKTIKTMADDSRPILKHATAIADDARKTVASIREDVGRVTEAAALVSEQLLDAAEVTARRIDEVNAVIDVVQDELEQVAISSVAAMRGVKVGATEMASALGGRQNGRHRVPRSVREELASRRRAELPDEFPDEVEPG